MANKIEEVNLRVFNIIKNINEWKTLSCETRCEFDGSKCNSILKWNSDECQCECKKQ